MKIKFSHEMHDLNGKPISMEPNGSKAATVKELCVQGLLMVTQLEQAKMNKAEAIKRRDLAVKIKNFGDEAEMTAEDCEFIKQCIGPKYIPLVVAECCDILDGKEPNR